MAKPNEPKLTYAVQWKLQSRPDRWEYYSRYWPSYEQAMTSYEAALAVPHCIDCRIVERRQVHRIVKHRMEETP